MSSTISRFISAAPTTSKTPSQNSKSLTFHPTSHASFLKSKDLLTCRFHGSSMARRNVVVRSNNTPPPASPLPSGSPSGSLRNWIVGIVLTFVLPFFTHKWGPLLLLKTKVDTMVDTAEQVVEAIETVAEKIDDVIDDITDDLPETSKLKNRLESIDEMVEGVAKTAHIANDIIDKVEEVEEKVDSLIHDHEEAKGRGGSKQAVVHNEEDATEETSGED